MERIESFFKRKNIVISAKRYGIDALGAMAQGLGSLTANYSFYKPQALIKTGFQSYFFVNSYVIFCSYL